ncbi:DUF4331 domain-containing protein [Bradyrhizobium elkanii]|uniref:DUF4331 domain-containing protein n=1 Tax=Bradyrhizobium elkanii TaxID=29448 RepID=UPI002169370A|nr:DUF4331 domain-containing protein [Bradyrhizobium elkanii]MCS3522205.1 hypothetical protein [Bradyrhizobium elkanii]MCS4069859.1 hypothetical protein [Bradyrhizobium elkanii]MCS4076490.1 hypothetical protein [Bradyrhizobium elkanii]MCW2124952.1 hypothetical protein [Bradyrhizobium elkanii]MCW2171698.1 hypothetical protein [Bradyrhizobium elkanii]
MSHHLDSPIARQDIRLDITDLYCFRGERGTVLVINTCHSIAGPIPSPGFHPEGMYEFKIDLNQDAVEEVTYRVKFGDRDSHGKQQLTLFRIDGADARDPQSPGVQILSGSTEQELGNAAGLRLWAGKAGDPFWIEPDLLHAVGHVLQDGTIINLQGWNPSRAKNLFAGHSVYSLVLELPDGDLIGSGADRRKINVWAVASLATDAGGWRSINRVGLPMIHPLFTQFNEELGNRLNAGNPLDDFETFGETAIKAIAGAVRANGTADDPEGYATKIARRFFPNLLPYEVGSDAVFGFGDWNGRSLTDNAPDVMFSIATNSPVRLGIGKDSVTSKPSKSFPYVPRPSA